MRMIRGKLSGFFGGGFRVLARFFRCFSGSLFSSVFFDIPAFQPFPLLIPGERIAGAVTESGFVDCTGFNGWRCFVLPGLIQMM
ncbi:MAG: hypothetical protein IK099_03825, partial [Clostridia bacterium]|nr:hypothetical protein [Clostridia bacterium]